MDVGEWLGGLGLRQYAKAFAENGIDAEVLRQLTADDLKELGVALLGHRRKLLTALEDLRSGKAASSPAPLPEHVGTPDMQVAASPERRHLTVLFCDLVGSTALSARLDPEDLREFIRRYHAVVAETVRSQGGFVAQYLGDGALIYFGFPAAHEDDAERAVRAALLVRKEAQTIKVKGDSLQVRAGLATGLVIVGDRAEGSKASHEPQVMGETPNRAARLQTLAEPGGVVIDGATRKLVGRMFDLKDRPAATLKGFDTPVECWDVLGEAAIESRFEALRSGETPLIGREEELYLLTLRWQQAKAGSGRVVLISGEPGLGKSRLVSAFEERLKADNAIELRYFCSPQHTSTALYPVITHLSRATKLADSDTPQQKLEKLRTVVAKSEDLPFIADLFSVAAVPDARFDELAPEERRQRVFAALSGRIAALAGKAPLFILIEDTHWVDPTTQELIDQLVSNISRLPVLLVITCRQEYQPSWTAHPTVTALVLTRLRSEDCAALVRHLTASGQLPSDMVDKIAERTDGIPLFAEELSKALMDAGKGVVRNNVLAADLHVPDTLHASLIARLDHLGAGARETAQAGSVIGREFSHGLLTRMAAASDILRPQKIEDALHALVGSGLIFARGTAPDAVYTFKHVLVQDAAYSTLLRTQRQKFHAALATIMEADGKVAPEVLAYHFTGAGDCEKAADQWFKAGQAANERSANPEALRSFQNALDIISSLPETRERKLLALEITGAMCNPATAANWIRSETIEITNRAARLAEELGVSPPAAVLYHQALHHLGASRHREAFRILQLFSEAAGAEFQTRAESSMSTAIYMSGGSLEAALEHSSRALAGYDRKAHSKQRFQYTYEPRCAALAGQSLQLTLRGYFEQSKAAERDGVDYAAEFGHPQTTAHQLAYKLLRGEFQQDYSEQDETAAALAQHTSEYKIVFWSLWTNIFRGFAAARNGRPLEGVEMIDNSLEIFADMKFTYYRPYHLGLKARVYELAGDIENALASVSGAVAFARESGETVVLADLIRLCGELRLAQSGGSAVDVAENLFKEAIGLAQAQASKLHELRAAASLARLWSRQARGADAQKLLQPVYAWFTEGLQAPDLANARAVLDDLAADVQQHENA
jgi:class 3 adenylate cyclase/predicted ATPase